MASKNNRGKAQRVPKRPRKLEPLNLQNQINRARVALAARSNDEIELLKKMLESAQTIADQAEITAILARVKSGVQREMEIMTTEMLRAGGVGFYLPDDDEDQPAELPGQEPRTPLRDLMQRQIDSVTGTGAELDKYEFRISPNLVDELGGEDETHYREARIPSRAIPLVVDPDVPPGQVYLVEAKPKLQGLH